MSQIAIAPDSDIARLLAHYQLEQGVPDELLDPSGALRPAWRGLLEHVARQSPDQLERMHRRGDAYLRDSGVFMRQYTDDKADERPWPLSHMPVLIHESDWASIVDGLTQRADILEHVAADLYGENTLVRDGFLPGGLIAQSPEWLRPLVGVKPASGHFLNFLAFEIGRGPNGQWWVVNDRTQAPSGAGYALENRVATSRIYSEFYPGAHVRRVANFFTDFRTTLLNMRRSPDSHVAILTPGPFSETYFEQSYIARYLGLLLVEGEDLAVTDGKVYVRTVSGLQPIEVLWRRLDALYADPLELDESSQLGTAGLVGATRRGTVSVVNALGTGILETRALMAFLPRIARHLTGGPLKIPNIATWWCGQPREKRHVLANVDTMMIAPALSTSMLFDANETTMMGEQLRASGRQTMQQLLQEEGAHLVGQEAVTFSTSPAWIDGQLVPRAMSLRVFMVRTANGWSVMPGGFARIGAEPYSNVLSMQKGGSVADVWIVSDTPVSTASNINSSISAEPRARQGALPSQAAENIYWLGRNVERAEGIARLNRSYHLRLAGGEAPTSPLLARLSGYMKYIGVDPDMAIPKALSAAIHAAARTAGSVRDRVSPDGWAAISDLRDSLQAMERTSDPSSDETARQMGVLLRKSSAFTGLLQDNMYRFTEWRFLSLGRSIERLMSLASALASFLHPDAPAGSLDLALEYADSTISHRRRYSFEATRASVIDLIALDPLSPRSLVFHFGELQTYCEALSHSITTRDVSNVLAEITRLRAELLTTHNEQIDSNRLLALYDDVGAVSNMLTDAFMR
ncbi:circularly permuted type 2 ATP-grasp protein [Henriciella litoralis]|uniref:circularly permuted type 2 ATP-grasp protein n=1 Tax=Henriciella litoralis TaxID=568102 RepID=UPI000A05A2CB|nr:circularly permuted type 2 ATP-grasp protein [Henriciella litoralis]